LNSFASWVVTSLTKKGGGQSNTGTTGREKKKGGQSVEKGSRGGIEKKHDAAGFSQKGRPTPKKEKASG